MSTLASTPSSVSIGLRRAPSSHHQPKRVDGSRGLAAMLLAAVVAAMVVLADRVISTWADGHLLLAWVFLWVVVFAGLALFADSARRMARRGIVVLDSWSESMAEARAETRLWEMARQDPRLMSELTLARTRAEQDEPATSFDSALAPLGLPVATATIAAPEVSYWERLGQARAARHMHNRYL
ncbi:hypothetical protein BSY239_3954 [Hydrogenophaga sp. RAC07]|uniref:hypothetical protein n=1 Tax=Hydrogenophaga sp. RAC07 TaxID=1842537 RepID=UPI00083E0979|nr:hypothetical protein [Hydrogenophaga sp. RAC07]AOF86052.1 hypothetical protein BSY239_3954 [Hydrogenophaga sp. RAC07]